MANPHEPHFLKPLLLHEGDMVFHVTPFGHRCCEIQYTHPHIIKEEAEADDDALRVMLMTMSITTRLVSFNQSSP